MKILEEEDFIKNYKDKVVYIFDSETNKLHKGRIHSYDYDTEFMNIDRFWIIFDKPLQGNIKGHFDRGTYSLEDLIFDKYRKEKIKILLEI